VRDDLYPLTKAERRAALAGWRATSLADRLEACRLAKAGLPAPDPAVSAAARRWGEYLLLRHWSNRIPRGLGTYVGLVGTLAALVLVAVDSRLTDDLVPLACGLVATGLGLLSWGRRRAGHRLVRANAPAADLVTPR
jgi:hypothetical protein